MIGIAIGLALMSVFFWVAAIVIGAWLLYVLRHPILVVLILIWRAVTFVGRGVGKVFKRRPPAPKQLVQIEPPPST